MVIAAVNNDDGRASKFVYELSSRVPARRNTFDGLMGEVRVFSVC